MWQLLALASCVVSAVPLFHRFAFNPVMPEQPAAAWLVSVVLALMLGTVVFIWMLRIHNELVERMNPHLELLADDLREGIVEVHSHDAVDSHFDMEQDQKIRDLVVRFPEAAVRVDTAICEHAKVSEPFHGWCEIVRLPRSGQVLDLKTKPVEARELASG
jgi:hypothetical protein